MKKKRVSNKCGQIHYIKKEDNLQNWVKKNQNNDKNPLG